MRIIAALRERDAEKAIRELRVHMAASYAWVMPCSRLSGNRLPPAALIAGASWAFPNGPGNQPTVEGF
jgi:hypothetical protein